MSWTVSVALFGWPLIVLGLFTVMHPRRAVITAFIVGWLFLPVAGFSFQGLPEYTKVEATCLGALLGTFLFDGGRFARFRPSLIDIPMVVWCTTPIITSVANGLGTYEGMSFAFQTTVWWGIPYFIGRLYLTDLDAFRDLALGIFIGGLVYMPLCLFEVRMSPRLHIWLYGFHQHSWGQVHRGGGYRPTVFLQHGIAVGLWMATASICGWWLGLTRAVTRLRHVPVGYLALPLIVTMILCKSVGALVLLGVGMASLFATRACRTRKVALVLILAPLIYMGARSTGVWDGSHLVDTMQVVSSRAHSLQYRLDAETILAAHALRRPLFGWGRFSRNRPAEMGENVKNVATDGLWIIALGQRGVVGLAALILALLLPVSMFLYALPAQAWCHRHIAPAVGLAFIVVLFVIDCLFNAMLNPVYLLISGGLAGLCALEPLRRRAQPRAVNATSPRIALLDRR